MPKTTTIDLSKHLSKEEFRYLVEALETEYDGIGGYEAEVEVRKRIASINVKLQLGLFGGIELPKDGVEPD